MAYDSASKFNKMLLQRLETRAAKLISGLGPRCSTNTLVHNLFWLSMEHWMDRHKCVIVVKCWNALTPDYLVNSSRLIIPFFFFSFFFFFFWLIEYFICTKIHNMNISMEINLSRFVVSNIYKYICLVYMHSSYTIVYFFDLYIQCALVYNYFTI